MKVWKQLKSDEKTAVILAQSLIKKQGASLVELQKMMEVEDFLESRGLRSFDYNLKNKKNFNEIQPETLKEFLDGN